MKELFERIAKKIKILHNKEFTGFSIDFGRNRGRQIHFASASICPKLDGAPCWYIHGTNFNGDIEEFAEKLDERLTKDLEHLTNRIDDVLEKNEVF